MNKRKKKKSLKIIDLIIATIFSLIISFYILPNGVNYVLNIINNVPHSLKMELLLSGKKYLKNNTEANYVTLDTLFKTGYLIKNKTLKDNQCYYSISKVKRNIDEKDSYSLDLMCINDISSLTLLE